MLILITKFILNNCIEIVDAEWFFTPFIIYCVSFYSLLQGMIYYYTRTAPCPFKVYMILGSVILGCVIGKILGLSILWYKENIYFPSLEDSNNISLESPINNSELNATQSETHNDLLAFLFIYQI